MEIVNDQAIAIVNGAIAQLTALAAAQQATVDADKTDAAAAQAKLDADNVDIATGQANVTSTNAISASLAALVAVPPAA